MHVSEAANDTFQVTQDVAQCITELRNQTASLDKSAREFLGKIRSMSA